MKSYEPVAGVMLLDGKPLITHDDRLLLRAQKSELGLFVNWRDGAQIARKDEEPVIVSWHHVDDVRKTCSTPPPGEEDLWKPQFERTVPLDGVRVSLKNNQLDVELLDLQNDLCSRYRKALAVLVDMIDVGVVQYIPRVKEPTERNIKEAIRHRMRRYAKVTTYEHNLIFRGNIGTLMFEALKAHDRANQAYENIVYLQGFKPYDTRQTSQKFYSITKKESRRDTPADELWKLETTFYKSYFKANNLRDVAKFIEQPDIQDVLFESLVKKLTSVIKLLREGGIKMELEFDINTASPKEQARKILKREFTLTERVRALERKTKEHDVRLDEIEHHLKSR